jgi:ADP-ribosyl-[dinitrogen reductase] hydrolase
VHDQPHDRPHDRPGDEADDQPAARPAGPGPGVEPGPAPLGRTVLDRAVLDRASGVLVAQACGDALGVPYEFARPPGDDEQPEMRGGGLGPYAPGEWSDDTQMSVCVARVAARGGGLTTEAELDEVAAAFEAWRTGGASDVGTQTATVLRDAAGLPGGAAHRLRTAAALLHAVTGRTAGNGALMRTGVVGLVALHDREATARAARAVAVLTHPDPLAGDSCVLWSEAVRLAVVEQRLDVRAGLDLLPAERRAGWADHLTDAERRHPEADLAGGNGFTVTALQAAWHAIVSTEPPRGDAAGGLHLPAALAAAVRTGGDTDTVAAIAGALLGARYGTGAVPEAWLRAVHGWPGLGARRLGALGRATAQGGPGRVGTPGTQTCPLCGTRGTRTERYPDHVCVWCAGWTTDRQGRRVALHNASLFGGFTAKRPDGSPVDAEVLAGRVWIDGRPLVAGEARFGGVVVQVPGEEHAALAGTEVAP